MLGLYYTCRAQYMEHAVIFRLTYTGYVTMVFNSGDFYLTGTALLRLKVSYKLIILQSFNTSIL